MLNFLKKIFPGKKPVIEADAVLPSQPVKLPHPWYMRNPKKAVEFKSEKYRPLKAVIREPEKSAWNPMLRFPRNNPCFCASGVKFKKCCLPRMTRVISKENAKFIQQYWDDFIVGKFTTKDVKPQS
jgi:SEC-C motif